MSELRRYGVTVIRGGDVRELHQGIRYERGRAVAYRCPRCDGLHPLDPRDYDEARGLYVGRRCGEAARVADFRARANAYRRRYWWAHPEFRERELGRMRQRMRALRAAAREAGS